MGSIELRAWNPIEEKMEYWTLNDLCYNSNRPDLCLQDWQRPTGLHDKNGKEIYEGDVVKWEDGVFNVTYCNGAFKVMEMKSMFEGARDGWLHEMAGQFCKCSGSAIRCEEIEIIKNIYENPEPLTQRTN